MNFQNYIVKDGQAVPEIENPYTKRTSQFYENQDHPWFKSVNSNWQEFETWKQSHTYATNAKNGVYTKDRFDIVWQVRHWHTNFSEWLSWHDTTENYAKTLYPITSETRQFAKLKEEVEKPKESAQLTIGDTSFTKLQDGFIQILTKNGCVELMPDEIEQLAKFIK